LERRRSFCDQPTPPGRPAAALLAYFLARQPPAPRGPIRPAGHNNSLVLLCATAVVGERSTTTPGVPSLRRPLHVPRATPLAGTTPRDPVLYAPGAQRRPCSGAGRPAATSPSPLPAAPRLAATHRSPKLAQAARGGARLVAGVKAWDGRAKNPFSVSWGRRGWLRTCPAGEVL
jgi:hypothetical protein